MQTTAIQLMKTPEADWPAGWRKGPGGRPYEDAAQRMTDAMNLHALAHARGWAVFALADGKSDQTAYDTIDAAYRSKGWNRDRYAYVEIQAGGVSDPAEMQGVLDYARTLHDMGARLPDPRDFHAGDRHFPYHQPPVLRSDWGRQIRELARRN